MKLNAEELANVPPLDACKPGMKPFEFKVVVAMARPPEKTRGGILMPDNARERNEMAAQLGRLVATSPMAFTYDQAAGEEAPPIGSLVAIGKFSGAEFTGPDGHFYRLMNDRDIIGIIDEEAVTAQ